MKLKVDEQLDTLCLRLNEAAIVESEVQSGVILDFDAAGRAVALNYWALNDRMNGNALRWAKPGRRPSTAFEIT